MEGYGTTGCTGTWYLLAYACVFSYSVFRCEQEVEPRYVERYEPVPVLQNTQ
jgi:hypothetical protein